MADRTPNHGEQKDGDFSILDLPDDELLKYGTPEALFAAKGVPAVGTAGEPGAGDPAADAGTGKADGDDADDDADPDAENGQGEKAGAAEPGAGAAAAGKESQPGVNPTAGDAGAAAPGSTAKPAATEKPAAAPAEKAGEEKPAADAIDYKAEYERLTGTFKANGRDMRVTSVDEAIQLMQMGAGYAKKMAALKPNLALLKMLEKNGLLSEEKVGFLIDVSRKDPNAINKLLKEGNLDPMGLDPEKAGEYKPGAHKVDPREVELDAVMDEIQHTPTFQRCLKVVTQEWDEKSRQEFASNPHLFRVINAQMGAGVFDLISTEMDRLEALGQLAGVSHLDAYKQIGDAMAKAGKFQHLLQGQQQGQGAPAGNAAPAAQQTPPVIVPPKSEEAKRAEAERIAKRRAAGGPRAGGPAPAKADFNPLAMSDEEFMKLARQGQAA